jgi:hypothetical protein
MSRAWATKPSLLAGERYELKVGRALASLFPPPACIYPQYPLGRGRLDYLITRPDLPPILAECKASLSLEAFAQLARYASQVHAPCIRAIICQRAGGCRLPVAVELLPAFSTLALPALKPSVTYVLPWTGRFPVNLPQTTQN